MMEHSDTCVACAACVATELKAEMMEEQHSDACNACCAYSAYADWVAYAAYATCATAELKAEIICHPTCGRLEYKCVRKMQRRRINISERIWSTNCPFKSLDEMRKSWLRLESYGQAYVC